MGEEEKMPYINETRRNVLGVEGLSTNTSDLAYLIFREALNVIQTRGSSYAVFAEVIGAIETAKMELYRRIVGPHEDGAIERNGDIAGVKR